MKATFVRSLLLLLTLGNVSLSTTIDTYWISYTGEPKGFGSPTVLEANYAVPGGPKYLMKIDAVGNVLVPPTQVVPNSSGYVSPLGGGTALTDTSDTKLTMWFPHKHQTKTSRHFIWKALIQKSPLRLLSLERTKLVTTN